MIPIELPHLSGQILTHLYRDKVLAHSCGGGMAHF